MDKSNESRRTVWLVALIPGLLLGLLVTANLALAPGAYPPLNVVFNLVLGFVATVIGITVYRRDKRYQPRLEFLYAFLTPSLCLLAWLLQLATR
jgi:hypothetical protein